MTMVIFERARLPATPWKNGGGVTREIACVPPQSGMHDFDWRLSIAHIACDGDFSVFEGVDRVITLLEGAGVQLHSPSGGVEHRLDTPGSPFAFPGDVPVHARLLAGDCHDLNVMTRRGVCRAEVSVLKPGDVLATCTAGLLLALQGSWRLDAKGLGPESAASLNVAADSGVWWHQEMLTWRAQSPHTDAALLTVRILPATP